MWILPKQISSTISLSAQGTRESDKDSEEFCQMCEKSLMWRSKPSLSRTWSTRLKRGGFIKHLFIRTLKPSLTESFEGWWTSSVEDFPASRFLKLELEKLRKTQDTCSPSSQKESESANLELFSSKMSKESSAAKPKTENQFSNMSSEHWKKWVTEQRQEYLARAKSVRRIKEKESSSWATPRVGGQDESHETAQKRGRESLPSQMDKVENWATPRAGATDNTRPNNKGGIPLGDQAKRNWPTASVAGCVEGGVANNVQMDEKGTFYRYNKKGEKWSVKLRDAVIHHEKNWATPSTMDNLPARSPEKLAEAKKKGGCRNLREDVVNFPTPTARDWKDTAGSKKGRDLSLPKMLFGCTNDGPQDQTKNNTNGKNPVSLRLNPNWVEQLMGLPVGWTDLDFLEME